MISHELPVPKETEGRVIESGINLLTFFEAITEFIVYPTNDGGVPNMMISIRYGPVVPAEFVKLTPN